MRLLLTITIFLFLSSCGLSTKVEQILTLEMYGVFEAPLEPIGDVTPHNQEYLLLSFALTGSDGNTQTMFDEEILAYVAGRPQIVFSEDISDFTGDAFTAATLVLDTEVFGISPNSSDHYTVLSQPTITYSEPFTVEEGKGLDFHVKVKWKDTINGDEMQEPEIVMTRE